MSDPPRTRAQDEAADWLARLGHAAVSTDTLRAFRDWRDDPENDAAYAEAEAFWEASGRHAADPGILAMTAEALDRGRRPAPRRNWLHGPRLAWALGLTGLSAAGGAGVLAVQALPPVYATEAAEQRIVRLEDGSRVHLNVDSRVRVAYRDDQRRIVLTRGEAFFDVAPDPARPFVVEAGPARIRALGTRFDVRRTNGDVEVTLLQGSVRVTPGAAGPDDPGVVLTPNQQARIAPGRRIRTTAAHAAEATAWTTGRLAFRDTPLAAAVAEVNRYARTPVVLADPALGARRLSGHFDLGDSEAFARGVALLFGLEAVAADDAWRLQRKAGA